MANTQFNSVDGYAVGNATIVIYANSSMVGNVITASSNVTAPQLISNVATGTAPLTVTSTTRVANLNVAYANVSDYVVVTTQTTGVYYPVFVNANTTANYAHASNAAFSANLANGALIATTFVGALSGAATSATTAGTVTTAAQPNITSVGTLTSLAVTGNTTSGNFIGVFANGNSSIAIPSANGNINLNAAGAATPELIVTSTGVNVTGTLNATGNANVGNIGATNANVTAITASGNANVGNLGTSGLIVATGNVTGGNLVTGGVLSVTGNANVGNLGTAGLITATGNITGGNLIGTLAAGNSNIAITSNANITFYVAGNATARFTATSTGVNVAGTLNATGNANVGNLGTAGLIVATGNITGGNLNTGGLIAATGNITGGNLIGALANGRSNINITSSANITMYVDTSAKFTVTTNGANVTGSLGISTTLSVTGNSNVGNLGTSGLVVATGNVTGGNLVTGGVLSVTGNANVGNLGTAGLITATGNITGGNLISTNYALVSVATGISAAGTVVGNATALTKAVNVVSTVATGTGVSLPTAIAGMRLTILNVAGNALNVYPLGNGIINSQAANAAYSQPAGARLDYICTAAATAPGGQWYTLNATYG